MNVNKAKEEQMENNIKNFRLLENIKSIYWSKSLLDFYFKNKVAKFIFLNRSRIGYFFPLIISSISSLLIGSFCANSELFNVDLDILCLTIINTSLMIIFLFCFRSFWNKITRKLIRMGHKELFTDDYIVSNDLVKEKNNWIYCYCINQKIVREIDLIIPFVEEWNTEEIERIRKDLLNLN